MNFQNVEVEWNLLHAHTFLLINTFKNNTFSNTYAVELLEQVLFSNCTITSPFIGAIGSPSVSMSCDTWNKQKTWVCFMYLNGLLENKCILISICNNYWLVFWLAISFPYVLRYITVVRHICMVREKPRDEGTYKHTI